MRRHSEEFLDLGSEFSASIAGVDDRAGLEQQHRGFGIGPWTVLDAAGDDEELPRPEHHIAVSHLDGEPSVEDQEELIGVGVPVPGELTLDLHDPDIVVVNLGNLLRRPVLSMPASRPDLPLPYPHRDTQLHKAARSERAVMPR